MPKASVIVPIYNAEKHLDKCIKSILTQSFSDFELILVNDGSKDNSLNICRKYQYQDKRVIIIDKKNEGSIAARRTGVEASVGNYVMFVDADDWIHKKALETLYLEAIQNDLDVTVCNIYKVYNNAALIKRKNQSSYFKEAKIYNREKIKEELVIAYFHGHPFPSSLFAKLYKRELLLSCGKYLKSIIFFGDDLYYNLEILLKSDRIKIIDKPLYFYRNGGNTSKYMPYLFNDMISGYQVQKEVIEEYYHETKQQRQNGISVMLLNTFKTCLYNLFNSDLNEEEIRQVLKDYVLNGSIIESINSEGSINYFQKEYLNAIKNRDIEYLYSLGKDLYRKRIPKVVLINVISKFSVI
ncbi:glycosyltransferase family 2 protein [Neobacillus drentensis]|uniref:glycosyltransferase family 2 protein n=1 Tax=Neobacillus drentensis TaxID=220684 RepID=UPI0028550892|nr:glycosyltransferase [Neobacillus drentensis]MDR7239971.1 glycosyltransferase involved in cell wall biosynthesis [Neobacillus drentensis]